MRGKLVKLRASAGTFALAVAVAACGSATRTVTVTVTQAAQANATTSQTQPPPTTTATTATTPLTGRVGTPFTDTDNSGNVMGVALVQIIDPAQGANEAYTPNNGFRFVGAKFNITGKSGTFSSDANTEAVLVGSDGQTYTAAFDAIAGCTNFNSGTFTVTSGGSSTGCVTFQVPQTVKVASVQWGGGLGGTPATWTP